MKRSFCLDLRLVHDSMVKCWLCFKAPIFCCTEINTAIHFKKWPHQPVMKAKQYVNLSFYVEMIYKACDLYDGTMLASLKQSQFEAMLVMTYLL